MRDQYVGDIGDYVKFALLRALAPERRLAVAWFKTVGPDEGKDGRHTTYLEPACEIEWRHLDPQLYDGLRRIALVEKNRSICRLERALDDCAPHFFDVPIEGIGARSVWFARLSHWAMRSDILFLDPDNGIATAGTASIKNVTLEEIEYLLGGARTLVVYHHQTRRKGGHKEEIAHIGQSLVPPGSYRAICAIRAGRYSPRVFFIVAPDRTLWDRAKDFADRWAQHVTFHAITEAPDQLGLTPGASAYHRADAAEPVIWQQIHDGDFDHILNSKANR